VCVCVCARVCVCVCVSGRKQLLLTKLKLAFPSAFVPSVLQSTLPSF